MLRSKRSEYFAAAVLMAPFVVIYAVIFVYPTIKMVQLSFTNAPLIGPGAVGRLRQLRASVVGPVVPHRDLEHRLFRRPERYPEHAARARCSPRNQSPEGLDAEPRPRRRFFCPYILPVSVVVTVWAWMFDKDFGIAQYVIAPFNDGHRVNIFRTIPLFMPAVAFITVWWGIGFNVLLFIAGLRNISSEIYEAAELDGAGRWTQFSRITWPLIWPVTVLVFTIQLILQLKIFDQVYLFAVGGRTNATMVMVQYIYREAFQQNHGGFADAAALILFLLIVVLSVLQFQLLRARGER